MQLVFFGCFVSLTYLCPSLPVEHRPSTTPRHRTLFCDVLAIPDQLVPCCFSSASVSCLQLLRGRRLFLFRCGFKVRAWRVVLDAGFLMVCPIQPHFLRCICLATGSRPAHRLVGLVVKTSASRAEGPGFESRLRRDFFGVESYR